MAATQSVGSTLSLVSGEPATFDSTGYAALTYEEIGEVTEVPTFGGSAQVITHIPLKTGTVQKTAGSIDYGEMTVTMAGDWADQGQIDAKSGFDGANARNVHSFELDTEFGKLYFTGLITGMQYTPGDANSNQMNSVTIALTSQPVEVAA